MSRIWDALKEAEQHRAKHPNPEPGGNEPVPNRRSTERLRRHLPVLIYGHSNNEPFHEATETLCTNAGGGLITLTTTVRRGQRLVLINNVNQKEQECRVIDLGSKYSERTAVGIGFKQPVPDFWDLGDRWQSKRVRRS